MFQNANLWEAGILLIGVAFVIGAIYLAVVLKKVSNTLDDVNSVIKDNRKAIELIMEEVETITRNSSMVAEDVQETVSSVKNSVMTVEKTVKTSKDYVLSPMLKTVSYAQAVMRIFGGKSKKKKKQ